MRIESLDQPVIFIDVESSGLHDRSYPIEVGWSDELLNVESLLIRPVAGWGTEDWCLQAEAVHGISRSSLDGEGVDAVEAARRLNERLRGALVLSDAPAFDAFWLGRLFGAASEQPAFRLESFYAYLQALSSMHGFGSGPGDDGVLAAVERSYPHTHRAGPDSLQMAAKWRAVSDPLWRRSVFAPCG